MMRKRWELYRENSLLARRIAGELGLQPLTAQLLINRGIETVPEAKQFFATELIHLQDPFLFSAMELAVERLLRAIQRGEKAVIFGDYDVDGITGTSLLWRVLTRMGARVDYYIPDRSEGYGMNPEAVQRLAQGGYTLIVTVDNGISCYAEVELANSLGMDVIITDHHEPPERIPPAYAVINPKTADCGYPFPYLAGVGVGFKLCQALAMRLRSDELMQYIIRQLDLVTLGTIADIVPLVGENRVIAANGLRRITDSGNAGVRALIRVAELEGKAINAGHVGFMLGPRINAIGRMDNPCLGVELLTTEDPEQAMALAEKLNQANRKRQMLEEVILQSAVEMIGRDRLAERPGLVLASEEWHHGIIGIAASKIVERYYRPTILISVHEGIGKGSARSVRGLNLYEALRHCREYLIGFGGHEMAAGLSIHPDQIKPFTEAFQRYVESVLAPEDLIPFVKVDAVMGAEELEFALLDELERLEPHGPGNPRPVLQLRRVAHEHSLVGANRDHLRLQVLAGQRKVGGIGFGMAGRSQELQENPLIDLIFQLERNHWQGRDYLQLMLNDLRPAELSLAERLFARAEVYLQVSGEEELPHPGERERRRAELAQEADAELVETIGRVLRFAEPIEGHRYGTDIFQKLLAGENLLLVSGSRRAEQLVWTYGAYQALRWGRTTVILCPTRGAAERRELQMRRRVQQLGLRLYLATGSLNGLAKIRLTEAVREGELDILLTTPAYLEANLATDKLLQERVGFLVLDDLPEFQSHAGLCTAYPRLCEWMAAPAHPSVLVTAPAGDEAAAAVLRGQLKINAVFALDEDKARRSCVDHRGIADREAYIRGILARGEKSLVWVHSPAAAVRVAKLIQTERNGVLYYHEGLPGCDRDEAVRLFRAGEAAALVATGALTVDDIADIRHVFLYHLSWDGTAFLRQCGAAGLDGEQAWIHLLYGKEDQTAQEALLLPRAPERERLVKIYLVLERLAGGAGVIRLSSERLQREFGLQGDMTGRSGIDHALQILAELGLLEEREEDGQRLIQMLPKPKQKLDLSSSIRYNEGIADKNAFNGFSEAALRWSADMISERILRSVFPEGLFAKGGIVE